MPQYYRSHTARYTRYHSTTHMYIPGVLLGSVMCSTLLCRWCTMLCPTLYCTLCYVLHTSTPSPSHVTYIHRGVEDTTHWYHGLGDVAVLLGAMLQLAIHSWIAALLFLWIGESYEVQGSRSSKQYIHSGRASTVLLSILLANSDYYAVRRHP